MISLFARCDISDLKKILVIQFGDIGDIVWGIPTFWAIRDSIPGVKIYAVVKEGFGKLLEMEPSISRVFEVGKNNKGLIVDISKQIDFLKKLRSQKFDIAVDLRSGDRGAFLAFLSGAKKRFTIKYEDVPFWRNLFFTHVLNPPPLGGVRGATDQSLRIFRELGIDTKNRIPKLNVSEDIKIRSCGILDSVGLKANSSMVTFNPFSRWSYKELPEVKWVEVLDWFCGKYNARPVIVGSQDEIEKVERIKEKCKGEVVNLAGRTGLDELAGVLSLSRLHVGVDSAAPHIAAAVGTPTVTIYGPSSWNDWAPIGEKHRIVVQDWECVPCRDKGCNGTERSLCLEELDIEKIKQAVCSIPESGDMV